MPNDTGPQPAARAYRTWGMRGKLTLLVSIIIFPCSLLPLVSAYRHHDHLMALKLQAQKQSAEALATKAAVMLDEVWATQHTLGQAILIGTPDTPEQIRKLLGEQLQRHPGVASFAWLSPTGVPIASTSPRAHALAPLAPILRARESEGPGASDLMLSPDSGDLSVLLTRSIWWEGALAGIMVAEVTPDRLQAGLTEVLPTTWTWTLIDRQYQLITGNAAISPGTLMTADHLARQRLVGSAYQGFFTGVGGDRRLGVSVPVGTAGWTVTVSTDLRELLADVGRAIELEVGAFFGLVLLALLGVAQLEEEILTPVRRLEETALTISAGNLGARVAPGSDDEIGTALAAFNQMAERIEDLEHQRTRFLQAAAHELRNPMAGVKAILSMLIWREQQGTPTAEIGLYLPTMEREIDRLSAHLDDILQAFSLQEGRMELNMEPLDLAEVILSSAGHFEVIGPADRLVLQHVEVGTVHVVGDRRRLEVVMRCLISNALKYSPCTEPVTVALHALGDQARILVSDRGIGIPAHDIEQVFNHFFRASNLAGRDPGGLGLGLYIAKEILLQHGGRIWVESAEEQGSTFYVALPRL